MGFLSPPSNEYRGVSLICFSHSSLTFSYQGWPVLSAYHYFKLNRLLQIFIQILYLKSTQRTPNLCCCCPLHYIHAHIWLCGGRESSSHRPVTFLSSLHCSVTVILHQLSRARCAPLWMLSKCFCRGEWGAQPPAVFSIFLFQTGTGRRYRGSQRICTAHTLQSKRVDNTLWAQ